MAFGDQRVRLGLIFGGRSGEHEVSLMSARSILSAIDPSKYQVTQIGITHQGEWLVGENVLEAMEQGAHGRLTTATLLPQPSRQVLYQLSPRDDGEMLEVFAELDVIFPLLHGSFGEDGTIQGLFELADLAYVGAGVLGSALGMDKGAFKDIMRAYQIPVVKYIIVTEKEIERDLQGVLRRAMALSDFPIFVKPANLGSSVGITKCLSASDLIEALHEAARYDRRVLIEQGIHAREIEVSVLGNEEAQASIPGEIIPSREFYSYEAKYLDGTSQLLIPAPIPDEIARQVQEFALRAYHAVDCAGMARVDFLLEKEASRPGDLPKVYLNELNTIPGFTQISMYPKLWEASGIPYAELIDRLVVLAMERKRQRDALERRFRREA